MLLGSFSDGKTSTIAGFAGELLKNMKIDTDESSDQLEHYKIPGNAGFEFVDTPGLFGTKEKEVDGARVRYSAVTAGYISEAHVVVYLCDAGVPLKESHVPVIRKVLRDFGKLESAVFVLNKMDEAGYDLTDEEDFREGCEIKKNALIKRLRDTIGLTEEEEARLRIVCIAAAPKGKGVDYWFADEKRAADYYRRSHIRDFRNLVQEVINETDKVKSMANVVNSGVKDVLLKLKEGISIAVGPLKEALRGGEMEEIDKIRAELESELEKIRGDLTDKLKARESSLTETLKKVGDDAAVLNVVLHDDIGMDGEKVDLGRVRDAVLGMLSDAKKASERKIKRASEPVKRELAKLKKRMAGAVKDSKKDLRLALASGGDASGDVLGVLSEGCAKFEMPTDWALLIETVTGAIAGGGALAAGASLAAAIPLAGVAVGIVVAGLKLWQKHEQKKAVEDAVPKVRSGIETLFRNVLQEVDGDAFYEKLAPGYLKLCGAIDEFKDRLEEHRSELAAREAFAKKVGAELAKFETC